MNERGREKGDDVERKDHGSRQGDRYDSRMLVDVEPVVVRVELHVHFHEPLVIRIENSGAQAQVDALTAEIKAQNDRLEAVIAENMPQDT